VSVGKEDGIEGDEEVVGKWIYQGNWTRRGNGNVNEMGT
jgi:hypothetical protein